MNGMNVPDNFHPMNPEPQEQRPNPYPNYMPPEGMPNYQNYRPSPFAGFNPMYPQQDFHQDNLAYARYLSQNGFPMNYPMSHEEYIIHVNNYLNPYYAYMFNMSQFVRMNGMYLPREHFGGYYRRHAQYMPQCFCSQRCWNHCAYEEEYEAYNNAYPQFIPQMHMPPPLVRMNQMYVPQPEFNNENPYERNAQNIPQDNAQLNEDMVNISSSEDEIDANDASTQILAQDDVAMDMNDFSSDDDGDETSNQANNTENTPGNSENDMPPLIRVHDVNALNKRYSIDTNNALPQITCPRMPPLVKMNDEECLCQIIASKIMRADAEKKKQNITFDTIESPDEELSQDYEANEPWHVGKMFRPNAEGHGPVSQKVVNLVNAFNMANMPTMPNMANIQPREYRGMDFDEDAEDEESVASNNDDTEDEAPQVKQRKYNPNVKLVNRMRPNAHRIPYMSMGPSTSQNNDIIVIEDDN